MSVIKIFKLILKSAALCLSRLLYLHSRSMHMEAAGEAVLALAQAHRIRRIRGKFKKEKQLH